MQNILYKYKYLNHIEFEKKFGLISEKKNVFK